MAEIKLDHVGFDYIDNRTERFSALHDVSLTVADGEFVCLLGQSGCGKSTLLSLLAGLHMPTRGEVRIRDVLVRRPGNGCAMVFQSYSLFPWMTARKNVAFGIRHSQRGLTGREAVCEAKKYLFLVGMGQDMDKYPYQLSGGMRQRAAIARAFAMDADILLLDEPFGALDTRMRTELQTLLENLWSNQGAKKKTVVFVTHDIEEALLLADRVIFMENGRIAAEIPIEFPRPRKACQEDLRYAAVRERLTRLFYRGEKL